MEQFILASASPRRKKLLSQLGLEFEVCPSNVDESLVDEDSPEKLVQVLSRLKAEEVADRKSGVIIAADTVVSIDGKVLEKPASERDAYQMLNKLDDNSHQVLTGITIIYNSKSLTDLQVTDVKFRKITEQELSQYIATGEPMDKAGSYAIQAKGALFVEEIKGCFYNVMGLPLAKLSQMLADLGVEINLNG